MPLYQASEVTISSGAAGTVNQTIDRLQTVSVNYAPPRTDVRVLGKFNQLRDRPVINYTPASFSVQYLKATKDIEANLGIVNSTGVGIAFANTDGLSIAGFGARNLTVLVSPSQNNNYNGQMVLRSGVVNSYSLSASVGQPAQISFGGEALDMRFEVNNNAKVAPNYNANLVESEAIAISGIDVSGFGLSGLTLQSFDLGINFTRQSSFQLGTKFPKRLITDINASLSLKGFFEGINSSFTGLSAYDCGSAYTGTMFFTLVPSCSTAPSTTYAVVNPYLDSFAYGAQVGSFSSIDLNFSIPISVNSGEAAAIYSGSNLIIL
jgi:hypothetical protein